MTRIAVFSSQAEKINVSIRFQTKSATNKTGEGRHRSQHDEEGLRESDFWIREKSLRGPPIIYNGPLSFSS